MKKPLSFTITLLLVLVLALTGCAGGSGGNTTNAPEADKPANAAETTENKTEGNSPANAPVEEAKVEFAASTATGEVTIWTFVSQLKEVGDEFNKQFPNIKVKVVDMGWAVHDKLATTLAAGTGAPDLAIIEQGQFPRYVTGGVLEDLLQQPYDAGRFQNDVSEYNWNRWKSVDGTKLLGMPWDVTPGVLYYRADIYEQLGLPSDPEELGEYLQDPENVLTVAQTLKADGKYFMEWGDGPVHWGGDAIGYFGNDLSWLRNNDNLAQLLDVTKRGEQLKWAPYQGWGSDKGKQMVKKGELTGTVIGSWGARELEKTFPDLKGKWRAAKMPFGLAVGMGGSSFVMPSQSKNKQAAWAFMEWATRSEDAWKIWTKYSIQPGWKNIQNLDWYIGHKNEYLGGQEDYKLYQELEANIPSRTLNPLDGKAWPIWLEGVQKAIKKNLDSKAILQEIQENIENKLKPDIEKLKKEMAK